MSEYIELLLRENDQSRPMSSIPSSHQELFKKRSFAHFATLMPSGIPHVTPVWIDYREADNRVLVNTAQGRQKHVNVQRDPRVGVSMTDPTDPYRALSLSGEVTEITESGATDHIDSLESRYRGNATYQGDRSNRVILAIKPETVLTR